MNPASLTKRLASWREMFFCLFGNYYIFERVKICTLSYEVILCFCVCFQSYIYSTNTTSHSDLLIFSWKLG